MIVDFPARDPHLRAIGVRLRRLREARGLSRPALARLARLEDGRLDRGERGLERLTSVELYALTLALHIPMRLLFEDGSSSVRR